jgi:hypothetical protein
MKFEIGTVKTTSDGKFQSYATSPSWGKLHVKIYYDKNYYGDEPEVLILEVIDPNYVLHNNDARKISDLIRDLQDLIYSIQTTVVSMFENKVRQELKDKEFKIEEIFITCTDYPHEITSVENNREIMGAIVQDPRFNTNYQNAGELEADCSSVTILLSSS